MAQIPQKQIIKWLINAGLSPGYSESKFEEAVDQIMWNIYVNKTLSEILR